MKAFLTLQNGRVFEGESFGAAGEAVGEIVFTTAMTGYNKTLTDPGYCGQIVVQTFPLIGNYGVITPEFESDGIFLSAYIVRDWCRHPSNFRGEGDIDAFLKEKNVIGLCGIDTRELTGIIRENGIMNAKITDKAPDVAEVVRELESFSFRNPVAKVTTDKVVIDTPENKKHRVILWDFGVKKSLKDALLLRGCEVVTVPAKISAQDIMDLSPDGIVLSNGPGDPSDDMQIISEIKNICKTDIPVFGICLGHSLLALANGGRTEKLKYGHHGGSQPVCEVKTGKVFITTQNHCYAVDSESVTDTAVITYRNANDGSCEGLEYPGKKIFSVQFHPETVSGQFNTSFLFDKFIKLMED